MAMGGRVTNESVAAAASLQPTGALTVGPTDVGACSSLAGMAIFSGGNLVFIPGAEIKTELVERWFGKLFPIEGVGTEVY